jgi:hypothetical protein
MLKRDTEIVHVRVYVTVSLVQGWQDCAPTGATIVPDLCVPRFLVAAVVVVSLETWLLHTFSGFDFEID